MENKVHHLRPYCLLDEVIVTLLFTCMAQPGYEFSDKPTVLTIKGTGAFHLSLLKLALSLFFSQKASAYDQEMPHFKTTDMTQQGRDTEQRQPLDRKSLNIYIKVLNLFSCKNLCFKNCIHMANEFFIPFFVKFAQEPFLRMVKLCQTNFISRKLMEHNCVKA